MFRPVEISKESDTLGGFEPAIPGLETDAHPLGRGLECE
ncbi:hypothetical protein AVEN_77878-1, partial [Araneus ventricosus]